MFTKSRLYLLVSALVLMCTMAACGGTADEPVNSISEPVLFSYQCFVRKGTTFPDDPLRNPMSMGVNPNDMSGSIVQGVQINKAVPGNPDSGKYTTSTGPRASISVQIAEFDAIKAFVNAAAAAGRQPVIGFVIQDNNQRVTFWPTVGAPTWTLRGIAPLTVNMNVVPGERADTNPDSAGFYVDAQPGGDISLNFKRAWIAHRVGFYEGQDYFNPESSMEAGLFLNDKMWSTMVSVLNGPNNARIQLTYESSPTILVGNKPLLGLPIFSSL